MLPGGGAISLIRSVRNYMAWHYFAIPVFLAVFGLNALAADAVIKVQDFAVPQGAHPHDVAAGADGIVWYTAQAQGALGRLDPKTGIVKQIPLGKKSAPHGVIIGQDQAYGSPMAE